MKTLGDFILLTGATGLLGQYLMRDLLARGKRVAVVIRSNKKFSSRQRMEQTMQMWERQAGRPLPRPVCLEGDITHENLGFDEKTLQWITNNCGSMIHSAASLTFHEQGGEPWRTNIEGTRNTLAVAERTDIGHMHYISTAYTCGHRHDLVAEDEFDVGQEFRNDYEKSKFEAEKLVRASDFFDCITVYRPVVITGDSVTGYTSTYHGTYLYMKMARILANHVEPDEDGQRRVPVRWGLKGDERRNITPVDWNAEIICKLFENEKAHGKTFHLGPSERMTMRSAIEYASRFYGLVGIEFRGYGTTPDEPLNELERWIWSNISIYGSYDFMDPEFDCTNLKKYAPTPKCPKLDWENAQRLMDYAEADRWGKRKPDPIEVPPLDVAEFLESRKVNPASASDRRELGLDVLGPGGGPWRLTLSADGIVDVDEGLPMHLTGAPMVAMPITALKEIDESPARVAEIIRAQVVLIDNAPAEIRERLIDALSNAVPAKS